MAKKSATKKRTPAKSSRGAKKKRETAVPQPPASEQVERELAASALKKRQAGDTPTSRELTALRKIEKEREEKARWEYYASIPKKHWVEMSGRQPKVINEQATRYKIPFDGRTINLPDVIRALHDFLATHGRRILTADEDGQLMAGGDSPELENLRRVKRQIAEHQYEEMRREVVSVAAFRSFHDDLAELLRNFGEDLQRVAGDVSTQLFERTLESADRLTEDFFSDSNSVPA